MGLFYGERVQDSVTEEVNQSALDTYCMVITPKQLTYACDQLFKAENVGHVRQAVEQFNDDGLKAVPIEIVENDKGMFLQFELGEMK